MTSAPLLTDDEIAARLVGLDWRREDEEIVRDLQFEDFLAAVAFVDRVAELAETYNHHPDILVHGWNKVKLSLSNHAAGGLTEIDFEMAARFDALPGQSEA
jgi:4a-hydroxytetrahydrobiopterin dehydratase